MKRTVATTTLGLLLAGAGCGSANKDAEHPASSLVYSPAARMPEAQDGLQSPRDGAQLQPGRRCRVHFRRDAAGYLGQTPLSVVGTSVHSERAQVVGTIERVDGDSITVRGDGSTYWIPREAILAVEFPDAR